VRQPEISRRGARRLQLLTMEVLVDKLVARLASRNPQAAELAMLQNPARYAKRF
jgi:hypothetical protein